jgi:signal transduction histidine kinase
MKQDVTMPKPNDTRALTSWRIRLSHWLVLGCLLWGLPLAAQENLAVLKRAAEKAEGVTKLALLNRIAAYFLPEENDKALTFGAEALALAQELKGEANTGTPEGNRRLRLILEQEVETNLIIGRAYANVDKKQKAIRRFRTAANTAENIGDEKRLKEAEAELEKLGSGRGVQINPGKVLQSVVETVEEAVAEDEREGQRASVMLAEELAAKAESNGNYRAAVEYYEGTIPFYRQEKDTTRLRTLYDKVASLYRLLGESAQAKKYDALLRGGALAPETLSGSGVRDSASPREFSDLIEAGGGSRPITQEEARTLRQRDAALQDAQRLAAEGDYEASYESLRRAQDLQQRIFAMEQQRREDSIETSNLIQNKVQEIENLRAQQELRTAQRNLAFIGLAAILITAGLLTYLFFAKRRSHRQVSRAYEALNQTHEQLKTTQSQLVSAEKMASLGQLTAGIAHEINNPVNFISGNLRPLHSDIDDLWTLIEAYRTRVQEAGLGEQFASVQAQEAELDLAYLREEIRELLTGIEEGAHRTTEIVSGLRNFARLDEEEYKRFDLHQGLDSTLALLKHHLDGIEVMRDYGTLPGVECYPGKLNQVFMNILTNAIQAMPEGGMLYLKTTVQADWVSIEVRDTGVGMDEATLARMFEPFFTTKDVGQGTGLGLSISHGIIRQHHGEIEAHSKPGKGTDMTIRLPVNQNEA